MADSTRQAKPKKAYPDFPLFPHATKRWAKKMRGTLHYFGPWDDPDAALAKWLDQQDDLRAGRTPRKPGDDLTVHELCNRFCEIKEQQCESGDLTRRTFVDYHAACKILLKTFGKNRLIIDLGAVPQYPGTISRTVGVRAATLRSGERRDCCRCV